MKSASSEPRWWGVALGDDIDRRKPLGGYCNNQPIVLFRAGDGAVRALADRCPHRRAPLSLGHITVDGRIQCGYHGWIFDGDSGNLSEIPKLGAEQSKRRCQVPRYPAFESDGIVYVYARAEAFGEAGQPGRIDYQPVGREFSGSATLPIAHEHFVGGLLDAPDLFTRLDGVRFVDYLLGDPRFGDGRLSVERAADWRLYPAFGPMASRAQHPLIWRTVTEAVTGRTTAALLDIDEQTLVTCLVDSTPAPRGTTTVRWHCSVAAGATGRGAAAMRLFARLRSPFTLRQTIDASALLARQSTASSAFSELSQSVPVRLSEVS